jgi:protein SCO1/2
MDHTGVVYLMDKRGRFVNAFNLERPAKDAANELAHYL